MGSNISLVLPGDVNLIILDYLGPNQDEFIKLSDQLELPASCMSRLNQLNIRSMLDHEQEHFHIIKYFINSI